jgi:urease accessory protein
MQRALVGTMAAAMSTVLAEPALAHHVMGNALPATFAQGLFSGLGHPIIGLDHLAALIAVGALAAGQRFPAALVAIFVAAMIAGVGAHIGEAPLPASEALAAAAVIALGVVLVRPRGVPVAAVLALFAAAGFVHGYALGESIIGAEPTPLAAYLFGLALIQSAIALAAAFGVRILVQRSEPALARVVGAAVAGFGLALLVQQLMPAT